MWSSVSGGGVGTVGRASRSLVIVAEMPQLASGAVVVGNSEVKVQPLVVSIMAAVECVADIGASFRAPVFLGITCGIAE